MLILKLYLYDCIKLAAFQIRVNNSNAKIAKIKGYTVSVKLKSYNIFRVLNILSTYMSCYLVEGMVQFFMFDS